MPALCAADAAEPADRNLAAALADPLGLVDRWRGAAGSEAISGSRSKEGVDIPRAFLKLMEGLENEDHDLIGSTFREFQTAVSQISSVRTELGAKMNRIERALSSGEMERIERKEAVANIEEADPVKVFNNLARDQTALKASLDTAYKILNEVPPDKLFR